MSTLRTTRLETRNHANRRDNRNVESDDKKVMIYASVKWQYYITIPSKNLNKASGETDTRRV